MTIVLLPRRERHRSHVYAAAVLATALVIVAAWPSHGSVGALIVAWGIAAIVAAAIDMRTRRLLNVIILPSILLVLGLALRAGRLDGALLGALLLGLPLLVAHSARPDGLGFGDVKFGVLLGAGIGIVAVPLVLPAYLLAAVAHAGACVLLRARGRLVPFGPALAGASIFVVVAELLRRS
jgi:leader peptidase (prepilin peptidase)/N-methyltransferase